TDDIVFLKENRFDFGELILKDHKTRLYWNQIDIPSITGPNFTLLAHGPHEGDPSSLANLWDNYVPALRETIDTAVRIKASILTVHLWVDPRYVSSPQIMEKKKALKELFFFAQRKGVTLSLENLSESASDIEFALEEIPNASITLDIGHGELLTNSNTSFEIISRLSKQINHVHAHDNAGGSGVKDDLHLPIGNGIINFEAILSALLASGYNRTITLELKPHELIVSRQRLVSIIERVKTRLNL
ncbi:MAG: sugar phosphate isomerase/epimerase family protein, partial [Desulfomonilaceae bacterium]